MHSLRVPPFDMQASIRGAQRGVPGTYPVSDKSSGCWPSGASEPDLAFGWQAPINIEDKQTSSSRMMAAVGRT